MLGLPSAFSMGVIPSYMSSSLEEMASDCIKAMKGNQSTPADDSSTAACVLLS